MPHIIDSDNNEFKNLYFFIITYSGIFTIQKHI